MARARTLKELRTKRKLTQKSAADAAGLSEMTVSRIERGRGADIDTLRKLAPVYGVSLTKLADALAATKAAKKSGELVAA